MNSDAAGWKIAEFCTLLIYFNYGQSIAHHGVWKPVDDTSVDGHLSKHGRHFSGEQSMNIITVNPNSNGHHRIRTRTGRHVCAKHHDTSSPTATDPTKIVQTHVIPIYKPFSQICDGNKICQGVRVEYQTAYNQPPSTGLEHQVEQLPPTMTNPATVYQCCPGWLPKGTSNYGCNKAICETPCANGGSCVLPGMCVCRPGYTGNFCEEDVDECSHPSLNKCDQVCINKFGNYQCDCINNFILMADGHSCRNANNIGTSIVTEARDLEPGPIKYKNITNDISLSQSPKYNQHQPLAGTVDDRTVLLLHSQIHNLQKKIDDMSRTYNDQLNSFESKLNTLRNEYENKIDVLIKRVENCCKPEKLQSNQTKGPLDFDYWFTDKMR